jgi:hypothetical protein
VLKNFIPRKMMFMPLIRHAFTALGGALAASGIASQAEAAAIVGGLIAAASVLWGLIEKSSDLDRINGNGN